MVTYKLSSQFAPRARGLPLVQQHRRVPGSAAAASVRLSLSGSTILDGTGKLSLSGPSDADKTGEEMLPRCRNGDDCHQRRPKLRLTGRDGPPGLYNQKVTGGSACPVSPAVVWFATQQPATAGTRKDLSASAGPDNVGMYIGKVIPDNVDRNVGYPWRDNVGDKSRGSSGMGKVRPFHHLSYRLNADRSVIVLIV